MEIFKYLRPPEDKPQISLAAEDKPWIHDQAIYRRNFSRVALVCHFFHSVMLPWMCESIKLLHMKRNGPSLNFARSIINGCGLAQITATHIKRCSIWDEDDLSLSWPKTEFQTLYSTALALMPNIEELNLSNIWGTKHLLRSMIALKCLKSLSLDGCLFLRAEDDICGFRLSELRLKSLRCFMRIDDSLLVSSLSLDSLLTLNTNHASFLTRIAEQDCHLPLQELGLDVPMLGEGLLPKAFQKIPALKKLTILNAMIPQHEIQFDDVLPVLEELCCPSVLLRSLVPGRPISRNQITHHEPFREIIDNIQLLTSMRRIRSLSVRTHVYQKVSGLFPNLESLRLEERNIQDLYDSQGSFNKVFAIYFLIKVKC